MIQRVADSIIEEIHRTREEISERFGGSIAAIAEDAARRQAASNRPAWKPETPNESLQPTPDSLPISRAG
uniref:Uncharacterized protein n=1 Tax=Candidatus Kentrum sp. LFY TaxID=2126342 RepID=A0A450UC08_9GAMM|nr:MAG: hypothetical protein BECKLFY1418B_GA0070995_101647 [Candidatus Kentron sp. LFY]VFJ91788.1 MAG: hypothetical protein BECKLFY1418A_GA0070994_101820 [Candidatus Kentron sp. LFY]